MGNVLSVRLQQCFIEFVVLFLEGSSETRLFRHLSNNGICIPEFQKYISYEGKPSLENV